MWKAFLANGNLGPISLQKPIDEVLQLLGPPEDREWEKDGGRVYYCDGALRIFYLRGAVYSFGVFFKIGTPQKPVLPSVLGIDVPFCGQSTMREIISFLDGHQILWEYDIRLEGAEALLIGKSIGAGFTDGELWTLASGPGAAEAIAKQKKRRNR